MRLVCNMSEASMYNSKVLKKTTLKYLYIMFSLLLLFAGVAFGRFHKHVMEGTNCGGTHHHAQLKADGSPFPQCHMTPAYPPPEERKLMEFVIDLDSDAKTRWSEPTTHFKAGINKMLDLVTGSLGDIDKYIDKNIDEYLNLFPNDWGDEVRGIATTLGADIGDVFLYNIAYGMLYSLFVSTVYTIVYT